MEYQVYLRPMTEADTDMVVAWRNKPSVKNYFIYQADFTREGHLRWLHEVVEKGHACQMIICDKEGDVPLGSVYIRDIDHSHHKGEYGIFIGEESARGRGIGTEAARLMIEHGFKELGLHRIYLRALAGNDAAVRSYEKAGFKHEGYLRDDVYINGKYVDIVWMAIVNEEKERED
ncbi:MAG: GNAT family N-acetyltransferase [Lachnospiraceae bacterium]|nr:GNAT family N-acetyltransferase [Lachnospiraceae bacterium]